MNPSILSFTGRKRPKRDNTPTNRVKRKATCVFLFGSLRHPASRALLYYQTAPSTKHQARIAATQYIATQANKRGSLITTER